MLTSKYCLEIFRDTPVPNYLFFVDHICKRKYPAAPTFVKHGKSVMLVERCRRVIFGVHNKGKSRDLGS